ALARHSYGIFKSFTERRLARQQRHLLHLHAAVRALHPVHFDVHRRLEYSPRQVAHCPLACVVGFGELAPAPGTFQLAVAALPPHPQPQLRSRLIDLVAIDPIAGPSQDFGELALSLQPESLTFKPALRIPRLTALRPNSCPEPPFAHPSGSSLP